MDRPRLLHRRSEHGYTEEPALALPREPEAISAQQNERKATEANARDKARAQAVWDEHLAPILIVLDQYDEHPSSVPARDEIRKVRTALGHVRKRLG